MHICLCGSFFQVDKGKAKERRRVCTRPKVVLEVAVLRSRQERCCCVGAGDALSPVSQSGELLTGLWPTGRVVVLLETKCRSSPELWWKEENLPLDQTLENPPPSPMWMITISWSDPKESLLWPVNTNYFCGQAINGNLSDAFQIFPL